MVHSVVCALVRAPICRRRRSSHPGIIWEAWLLCPWCTLCSVPVRAPCCCAGLARRGRAGSAATANAPLLGVRFPVSRLARLQRFREPRYAAFSALERPARSWSLLPVSLQPETAPLRLALAGTVAAVWSLVRFDGQAGCSRGVGQRRSHLMCCVIRRPLTCSSLSRPPILSRCSIRRLRFRTHQVGGSRC